MAQILQELDRAWSELATSPKARRALMRWSSVNADLAGFSDVTEVLEARRDSARVQRTQKALATLAADDEVAAYTLLKAMLPGLVTLAARLGHEDEDAIDEVISLAWERIRTYPCHRNGTVAANILLDVRKRYRQHRAIDAPSSIELTVDPVDADPSVEEEVLGRLLLCQLADAQRQGVVAPAVLAAILRTRVGGERLAEVAAEQDVAPELLCHRRWRAEGRLRGLPFAA